jgi:hypothetical protein
MVLPLITIAGVIFFLAIVFCVFGVTVSRLFRWTWILRQGPGFCAVVGLGGSILFLEVWNFGLPVGHPSVFVLAAISLGLAVMFWRTILETIRTWVTHRSLLSIAFLSLLFLLCSLFALGGAEHGHYDTGLYYLSSIRWAQQYPVVPGLANLHFRLGFNQSLFLFIAFLSQVANLGLARACQIVNPLIVFVSGWALLDRVRVNLATPKETRIRLYAILLLCPIFFLATHEYVSAPTADIAAAAFAVPAALVFCCCLEEIFDHNELEAVNWLLLLAACYCTIAKLKLSYAVLGVAGVGIAGLALVFVLPHGFLRSWVRITIVCLTLTVPWMARGTVLSGYPFFPSAVIRFRTDWAVPRRTAESETRWIYSWARMPEKEPSEVLKDNAWLKPWIERNAKDPENIFLLCFTEAGLVLALGSLLIPVSRKRRLIVTLLIAQSLLALLFWFKTAPEPRFGYASILLLGVNLFYLFSSAIAEVSMIRSSLFAGLAALGSFCFLWTTEFPSFNYYKKKFPHGFPNVEIESRTTDSGLRVGIPKQIQPWDSGLVVAPHFNPNLALRGRDLRDGFHIANPNR